MMNTMGEAATLTDKLALMPDQMLPRLAQQYKNDAITLSLILNEKTRRERLRNAATTRMAENQPKVNDQIVAGMQPQLPEQVGIGALPAPNMQQMADGGIAGMPEDDNSSLMYHNEPVMRMAGGGMTPEAGFVGSAGAPKLTDEQLASEYRQAMLSGQQNRAQALKAELDYRAGAMKKYQQFAAGGGVARYAPGGVTREMVDAAYQNWMAAKPSWFQQNTPMTDRRVAELEAEYNRLLSAYQSQPSAVQPGSTATAPAPYGNEGQRTTMAGVTPAPAGTGKGGLGDLAPPPAAPRASTPAVPAVTGPDVGKLKEQYLADVGAMAPKPESATDFLARRKEMLGDEGQAMSKYEAKLLAQEAAAPREKDESFWMAVTQAGLAAAAGASPYALKNIAEGFGTGLAGYRESLKEFKKAESERDKAMAAIESARRAEKRGDVDAAVAFEAKSQERLDRHNDRVAAGLASLTGSQISGEYGLAGHKISGEYSLAGHQVSAAASREGAQAYRQAALEQRNMQLVENIRKNIEAKLATQPQFMTNPAALAAEVENRLQIELQRYPGLAQYAGTPSGATKFSPADQALVNKYATPPR